MQYFHLSSFNCCLTTVLSLWKRGLPPKFAHVLYCHIKSAFFLNVYVFGCCFRMLAVILFSDFLIFYYYLELNRVKLLSIPLDRKYISFIINFRNDRRRKISEFFFASGIRSWFLPAVLLIGLRFIHHQLQQGNVSKSI